MNTVYKRQNEDDALTYQALARYYYNKADKYDLIHWGGIFVTLVLKFIWPNNLFVDLLLVVLFISSFFIESKIDVLTLKAASFKSEFDFYVLGINSELSTNLIDEHQHVINKKKKWFTVQKQNDESDTPNGIKNGYDIPEEMNQLKSFKTAIRQNINYDKVINKILLSVLVIVCILSLFIFKDENVLSYISTVFITLATLTDKIITASINIWKSDKINTKIEIILNKIQTKEDQIEILNLLAQKRQIVGISPNLIYKLLRFFKAF